MTLFGLIIYLGIPANRCFDA